MKKRILSLTLALVMSLGLLTVPASAAGLPQEAGIRDIQSVEWTSLAQEEPPVLNNLYSWNSSYRWNMYAKQYDSVSKKTPAHLILFDNGELWLSRETELGGQGWHKVMDNVKEIGSFSVPAVRRDTKFFARYSDGSGSMNSSTSVTINATLTAVVTEDGTLSLLGVPRELAFYTLPGLTYNWTDDFGFYSTTSTTFEDIFPFQYSRSPETPVRLAGGIQHFDGSGKWYADSQGNLYRGAYPGTDTQGERLPNNVIDLLVQTGGAEYQLQEDGTLTRGSTKYQNVKEFTNDFYLTGDGTVGQIGGKTIFSDVRTISGDWAIKNDGSLWYLKNGTVKAMEDVAAVFNNRYAVRADGSVYLMEDNGSGKPLSPRKVLSGNGLAPNPAPALHAGKIFKDASSWAMVDLRAARDYGLTIPTDGLSYNTPITREKFAEVAVRLYEALSGKKAPAVTQNPFYDTSNPEVLKAYALGIVMGRGEGQFDPDAHISREEIAVMLRRTVDAAGVTLRQNTAVSFADAASISGWAKDAVDAMARANVIRGVGDNRFDPKGTATVEQAIVMANRLLP